VPGGRHIYLLQHGEVCRPCLLAAALGMRHASSGRESG
jgi:hypothetical protein